MVAPLTNADPIALAWREAWTPPDRRDLPEWAAAHVVLQGDYATTGPFAVRDSTFLTWPLHLLRNDTTRMVNILKAPRTGGSLVGDIFLQDVIANRPGPFMGNWQTDDDAKKNALTRIDPTCRATPATRALWARAKQNRDLYRLPHMNLYLQGANLNSLQNKSIRYAWNSEVWLWAPGFLQKAFNRTEDHRRTCKILNESQGCDLKTEWESTWSSGKRHHFGVRCAACARLQPYEFFASMLGPDGQPVRDERGDFIRAGIVWDAAKDSTGRTSLARAQETTRFKCCHCGHEHADEPRTYERFAASAAYVCLDPDRSLVDVSLRWNALVMGDWHRIVKRFLQACDVRDQGSTTALKEFYIGPLATFWDPSLATQKITLTTGDYHLEPVLTARGALNPDYQPRPLDWELFRVLTADYQQGLAGDTRHLIVVCRAWGDQVQNRSRLLWQGRVNTFAELHALAAALAVKPANVGVDGSFEMVEVAKQCAKYDWTMLIGDDPEHFVHARKNKKAIRRPYSPFFRYDPDKGRLGQGRRYAVALRWSNPAIKNLVWNLRHGLAKHRWEVAADVSPEYRDGIDSEIKERVFPRGSAVPVWRWKAIKVNNHPWDCECMNATIAVAAGALTFDIEEDDQPADPGAASPPKKSPEHPTPPHNQPEQLTLLS